MLTVLFILKLKIANK